MRMGSICRRSAAAAALVLLAPVAAALGPAGCGKPQPISAEARRLAVIGIDAADWNHLDPLLAAGRLPRLAAFLAEATAVDMLSFVPLEKSPVLWASIATGLPPAGHGVGGFVQGDEQRPVRGAAWRAPALWDIAGAAGLSTQVIGYWATHPARPVAGTMVSDYFTFGARSPSVSAGAVWPDSLGPVLLPLQVEPESLTLEDLGRFVDLAALRGREESYRMQLRDLRSTYAADLSYLAVGRELARRGPADLFVIYLRGPDLIFHRFWRFHETDKSPAPVTPEERAIFGQVVTRYYEFIDEALGEMLSWFPPDRQVAVVSDHGFHGPRHRKRGWVLGTEEHRREGILAVRSPLYAADHGARPPRGRCELLDIAPTLLAMLELPPSREMPGAPLGEGLQGQGRRLVARLERDRVESYGALAPAAGGEVAEDPEVDEEIRRQLRSLGYIK